MKELKDLVSTSQSDFVSGMLSSGKSLSAAEKTLKTRRGTTWHNALTPFAQGVIQWESDSDINKVLRPFLDKVLEEELPEEKLASIPLGDKGDSKGLYAYRSWEGTKNFWKYSTVLVKAMNIGLSYTEVFNHPDLEGGIPSKSFIEGLIKEKKSLFEKMEPLLNSIEKLLDKASDEGGCSSSERETIQNAISTLLGKSASL